MLCRSDKEYRGGWETIHNILRTKLSPQRKAQSAMHILLWQPQSGKSHQISELQLLVEYHERDKTH